MKQTRLSSGYVHSVENQFVLEVHQGNKTATMMTKSQKAGDGSLVKAVIQLDFIFYHKPPSPVLGNSV